jgi:NADH-quinone oxidoreductase subunit M
MILIWLVTIPVLGAIAAWALGCWRPALSRWIALMSCVITLALASGVCLGTAHAPEQTIGQWLAEFKCPWIPQLGIGFHLAMDGLSLAMVVLTSFLGIMAVAASWRAVQNRVGFHYMNILLVLAGITGVFLAMDLFLFYFFWELMLIPMYFLIAIWGHENRHAAAIKFFIFTQLSGLLMLLSILGLYFVHVRNTGFYTFDYVNLLGTHMEPATAMWLLLGFTAAFLVKLPAIPFHTWLPDAHTEAPTAGSILLAGILLKTGAYGLIRFAVPLFPGAAMQLAPAAMTLGTIGILYGAIMAFAQTDFKRLVAYTSVSHLGFVLLGIFAWNTLALQGAVMQMICHGLSTGALFLLVGALDDRIHTRDMRRMGGLWSIAPRMGAMAMFFALASLGLPGLGNFVGEFLVLLGSFAVSPALAILATAGLVGATIYSLWMIQQTFHGSPREAWKFSDLTGREMTALLAMVLALIWLGLCPQPELNLTGPAIKHLLHSSAPANSDARNMSNNQTSEGTAR